MAKETAINHRLLWAGPFGPDRYCIDCVARMPHVSPQLKCLRWAWFLWSMVVVLEFQRVQGKLHGERNHEKFVFWSATNGGFGLQTNMSFDLDFAIRNMYDFECNYSTLWGYLQVGLKSGIVYAVFPFL